MDSAVEKARDLIALFQFQSQRGHGHAAEIVEVARAYLSSQSQVERMREVHAFLLGEGPLAGRWFGDDPPKMRSGRPRPYWWREHLRAALTKEENRPTSSRREVLEEAARAIEGMGWSTAEQAFAAQEAAAIVRSLAEEERP